MKTVQTMHLFCITIIKEEKIVDQVTDLSSFGFFEKSSVKEFMNFFSKSIIRNTDKSIRHCSEHEKFLIFSLNTSDLGYVIITDREYPERVAFSLLNRILQNYPSIDLNKIIIDGQDPCKIDKICSVNRDLNDIKAVITKTIDSVLEREGRINDLIEKSEDLSAQSVMFYKTTKSNNACCVIQ